MYYRQKKDLLRVSFFLIINEAMILVYMDVVLILCMRKYLMFMSLFISLL